MNIISNLRERDKRLHCAHFFPSTFSFLSPSSSSLYSQIHFNLHLFPKIKLQHGEIEDLSSIMDRLDFKIH